ncbi:microtubule-associated protein Jupiter isoform X2 [Megachile rotundata]|uniref:microtubule-associated protein Jupiter isoform X2 n=1 Tax=Megachile rotundata TaxID=143995 RepID=UPI003FD1C3D4
MTSTGTFQGFGDEKKKSSKVLKPPGGGSSDIFGAAPEETSPRRVKNHNQSQLGSALFGDAPNSNSNSNSNETPRNKPGNDSYKRLFGPPDAPPTTPNAKNHMRSNISLSGDSSSSSSASLGAATSPAKSTASSDSIAGVLNGYAASNGNNLTNDVTAFRRIKRFRGSSCITRNPVTGDGVDVTPIRRSARRCRDGNPVTGTGYAESQTNGPTVQNGTSSSNSSIGEKSNDSSPAAKVPTRTRVPPGGYSSGLW